MKTVKVRELMVPREEYAQLDEKNTLYDAIITLRNQQKNSDDTHTSILIVTKDENIASMLTILDIFRFMEPKYKDVQKLDLSRFGMQPDYVESMLKSYDLWASPLEDICERTTHITLQDFESEMIPRDSIDIEATLDMALHRMIVGNKHSLLVKEGETFVGVLRSYDIFKNFCQAIEDCAIPQGE